MPPQNASIAVLKVVRGKIADVYQVEASDDLHDNGTLSELNSALLAIQNCIAAIEKRNNE